MRDDKIKLTAVFTKDEAAVIKAMACKDDRTVSNFIRKTIVDIIGGKTCNGNSSSTMRNL